MTVDGLLGCISSHEITEWMAIAQIEAEDERLRELARKVSSGNNR